MNLTLNTEKGESFMLTPEMFAAMTASVLQHSQGHIQKALSLCSEIAEGEQDFEDLLKIAEALVNEIRVVREDMDRALLFLNMDDYDMDMINKSSAS
jgi:hypothetical protein